MYVIVAININHSRNTSFSHYKLTFDSEQSVLDSEQSVFGIVQSVLGIEQQFQDSTNIISKHTISLCYCTKYFT